jgi:hypothetical protein
VNAQPLLARIARALAHAKLDAVLIGNAAVVLRPYSPASSLFRVTDDDLVLQADFMGVIHGLRSFEGVKKRASTVETEPGRGSASPARGASPRGRS